MKKLIKWGAVLGFFAYVFLHYFVYWDPGNNCRIWIRPSILEFSNLGMKSALSALKYGSPSDYRTVCRHVSTINPNYACGGFGGGCFYSSSTREPEEGRMIYVSTTKNNLPAAILVIVHETCHAIQFQEGRPLNEGECYKEDDRVIREMVEL